MNKISPTTMKNLLLLLFLTTLFFSCEKSILDKSFYVDYYESDFKEFVRDPLISTEDAFLINYTILRQRDYFGYTTDKKTYGDILKMGRELKKNGIQVKEVYQEAEPQDGIEIKIEDPHVVVIPKKNRPSRKVKHIKYRVKFTNTSTVDVALNYITFVVEGPFGQHLITAGFEINCRLPRNGIQTLDFVINGKEIRDNLRYGKKDGIKRMMMDDVFRKLDVKLGGISIEQNSRFYDNCYRGDRVIEPFLTSDYKKMYPDGVKLEDVDGSPAINRGAKLYVQEDDGKIIQYK